MLASSFLPRYLPSPCSSCWLTPWPWWPFLSASYLPRKGDWRRPPQIDPKLTSDAWNIMDDTSSVTYLGACAFIPLTPSWLFFTASAPVDAVRIWRTRHGGPERSPPVGAIRRVGNRWGRVWGPCEPVRGIQVAEGPAATDHPAGWSAAVRPTTWRSHIDYRLGSSSRPGPAIRGSSHGRLAAERSILAWPLLPRPQAGVGGELLEGGGAWPPDGECVGATRGHALRRVKKQRIPHIVDERICTSLWHLLRCFHPFVLSRRWSFQLQHMKNKGKKKSAFLVVVNLF